MPLGNGTLVWVLTNSQKWPAIIIQPHSNESALDANHFVKFYGSQTVKWIPDKYLIEHSDEMEFVFQTSKKSTLLHYALEEMKQEIEKRKKLNTAGKSSHLERPPMIPEEDPFITSTQFESPPMKCNPLDTNYSKEYATGFNTDPLNQKYSNSSTGITEPSTSNNHNDDGFEIHGNSSSEIARPLSYYYEPISSGDENSNTNDDIPLIDMDFLQITKYITPVSSLFIDNNIPSGSGDNVFNSIQGPIANQATISPLGIDHNVITPKDESTFNNFPNKKLDFSFSDIFTEALNDSVINQPSIKLCPTVNKTVKSFDVTSKTINNLNNFLDIDKSQVLPVSISSSATQSDTNSNVPSIIQFVNKSATSCAETNADLLSDDLDAFNSMNKSVVDISVISSIYDEVSSSSSNNQCLIDMSATVSSTTLSSDTDDFHFSSLCDKAVKETEMSSIRINSNATTQSDTNSNVPSIIQFVNKSATSCEETITDLLSDDLDASNSMNKSVVDISVISSIYDEVSISSSNNQCLIDMSATVSSTTLSSDTDDFYFSSLCNKSVKETEMSSISINSNATTQSDTNSNVPSIIQFVNKSATSCEETITDLLSDDLDASNSMNKSVVDISIISSIYNEVSSSNNQCLIDMSATVSSTTLSSDTDDFHFSGLRDKAGKITEMSSISINSNATIQLDNDTYGLNNQSVVSKTASSSLDVPTDTALLPASNALSVIKYVSDESPATASLAVSNVIDIPEDASFINQSFADLSLGLSVHSNIFRDGLKTKVLRATDKEVGILGLDELGCVIAKSLLKSGHFITVWNKFHEVCNDFVMDCAENVQFPAELIEKCDIVFCCVSAKEIKDVVFGTKGVLDGLQRSKKGKTGIVMMSSIDPNYSQEINEEILKKCGRYLEAHLMKSIADNESVIICSGCIELYHDCLTCFSVMSNSIFHLGVDVGSASKMKAVFNVLTEMIYAALWDVLAFADSKNISLAVFNQFCSALFFPAMLKSATQALFENNDNATTIFKYFQSVNMASLLNTRNSSNACFSLASATNNFFLNANKEYCKALAAKYT